MTDTTAQSRLCWMDCESTGLLDTHRPWDVALILRDTTGFDRSYQWFIHPIDLDLASADPVALEVGHFWERHPHGPRLAEMTDHGHNLERLTDSSLYELPISSTRRAFSIANWIRDIVPDRALILGSNPAFDQGMVGRMMRRANVDPTWHYHPIDVPTLITGWLLGNRNFDLKVPGPVIGMKSDQLCQAIGLDLSEYVRHTALGDCELFRDAFDAIKDAR